MTTVGSQTRKFVFTRLRLSAHIYKSIRGATSVRSLALFHNGLVLLSQTPSIPPLPGSLPLFLLSAFSSLLFHSLSFSSAALLLFPFHIPPSLLISFIMSSRVTRASLVFWSDHRRWCQLSLRCGYMLIRARASRCGVNISPPRTRLECCWRRRARLVCLICDVLSDVNKNQLKRKKKKKKEESRGKQWLIPRLDCELASENTHTHTPKTSAHMLRWVAVIFRYSRVQRFCSGCLGRNAIGGAADFKAADVSPGIEPCDRMCVCACVWERKRARACEGNVCIYLLGNLLQMSNVNPGLPVSWHGRSLRLACQSIMRAVRVRLSHRSVTRLSLCGAPRPPPH